MYKLFQDAFAVTLYEHPLLLIVNEGKKKTRRARAQLQTEMYPCAQHT